jgi:hypothetical protein
MDEKNKLKSIFFGLDRLFESIWIFFIMSIPLSGLAVMAWQLYWWLRDAIWYPVSNKVVLCYIVNLCELRESKMKGLDVIKQYLFESSFSMTSFILFSMIFLWFAFKPRKPRGF